jgi:hypothetical protein
VRLDRGTDARPGAITTVDDRQASATHRADALPPAREPQRPLAFDRSTPDREQDRADQQQDNDEVARAKESG